MPDFSTGAAPTELKRQGGRFSLALSIALAVSAGLHAAVLFWMNIGLTETPQKPPPIYAELRPLPPQPPATRVTQPSEPQRAITPKSNPPEETPASSQKPSARRKKPPDASPVVAAPAQPRILATTESEEVAGQEHLSDSPNIGTVEEIPQASQGSSAEIPKEFRLPPRGIIRFRVDRGDSNFEIGAAYQQWEFEAGRYRLHSFVETTGLVGLLYSIQYEMESLGRFSEKGLQPEVFGIRRDGRRGREKALFDWDRMKVRVSDRPEQALDSGAQDLLSLYYQLGFLNLAGGQEDVLPVATGKKYGSYPLELVGDELIEVPMGSLSTRHVRSPGENTTELWLAYDYLMLPVKIRHTDSKGNVLVQVATEIRTGQ